MSRCECGQARPCPCDTALRRPGMRRIVLGAELKERERKAVSRKGLLRFADVRDAAARTIKRGVRI